MRKILLRNLAQRFESYNDLMQHIDDNTLGDRLGVPRDKNVRENLWCIVGTRESFAQAIAADSPLDWKCSMQQFDRADFIAALAESAASFLESVASVAAWSDHQADLLARIVEHEAMHEGQIIRQVWGLEKTLPESCYWTACG